LLPADQRVPDVPRPSVGRAGQPPQRARHRPRGAVPADPPGADRRRRRPHLQPGRVPGEAARRMNHPVGTRPPFWRRRITSAALGRLLLVAWWLLDRVVPKRADRWAFFGHPLKPDQLVENARAVYEQART